MLLATRLSILRWLKLSFVLVGLHERSDTQLLHQTRPKPQFHWAWLLWMIPNVHDKTNRHNLYNHQSNYASMGSDVCKQLIWKNRAPLLLPIVWPRLGNKTFHRRKIFYSIITKNFSILKFLSGLPRQSPAFACPSGKLCLKAQFGWMVIRKAIRFNHTFYCWLLYG